MWLTKASQKMPLWCGCTLCADVSWNEEDGSEDLAGRSYLVVGLEYKRRVGVFVMVLSTELLETVWSGLPRAVVDGTEGASSGRGRVWKQLLRLPAQVRGACALCSSLALGGSHWWTGVGAAGQQKRMQCGFCEVGRWFSKGEKHARIDRVI